MTCNTIKRLMQMVDDFRFVFMALMEYCLVNIVLGDSDLPPKPTDALKPDKIFDLAAKVDVSLCYWALQIAKNQLRLSFLVFGELSINVATNINFDYYELYDEVFVKYRNFFQTGSRNLYPSYCGLTLLISVTLEYISGHFAIYLST